MVSQATMTLLLITAVFLFLVPIILIFVLKKKYNASLKVFFIGMVTFIGFALILKAPFNIFITENEVTKPLLANPWLYALYGGLMAGIFEEIGRYIMLKYTLRGREAWRDGLTFGVGHGGIEMIVIVISQYILVVSINSGMLDLSTIPADQRIVPETLKNQLLESGWYTSLLMVIERIGALIFHIGASILVLYAIRTKKFKYVLYVIGFHTMLNFPAGFYHKGLISIWFVQGFVIVVAIGALTWIIKSKALFRGENNKI
jgi:uncharacterized membrane protein YhfC